MEEMHLIAPEPAWIQRIPMDPMGFCNGFPRLVPLEDIECRVRHARLFHRREVDGMPRLDVLRLGDSGDLQHGIATGAPQFLDDSWYFHDIVMIVLW